MTNYLKIFASLAAEKYLPKKKRTAENDTPKRAWEEICRAVAEKNYSNFSARLDFMKILNAGYDEVVEELAIHHDEFHEKYPQDLLFQFGAQNVRDYNAKYRIVHIGAILVTATTFFGGNVIRPEKFEDNPIKFAAAETEKFLSAVKSEIKDCKLTGNHATLTVEMTGDNSYYGKLAGRLNFELGFFKNDSGYWRLEKVENIPELVPQVLDFAETVWPHAWDLGIKY